MCSRGCLALLLLVLLQTSVGWSEGMVDQAVAEAGSSRESRSLTAWTVVGTYSYLDLWVPSKMGGAITYNMTPADSFEFEYLRGSVNYDFLKTSLGRLDDQRAAVIWRHFGHFN